MKIQVNGMIYDSEHRDCKCILNEAQGQVYAFIQCIDTGMDGNETAIPKRYWGQYAHAAPEASITRIMQNGGKWPVLPA
ncbi:hypothetical protein J4Z08_21035 [Citrobacter portucalensis]|uniref:hypothetical protein n=1 Tax=Citrobacter portucalensis TaxID=1639133 RepID=UPI0031404C19